MTATETPPAHWRAGEGPWTRQETQLVLPKGTTVSDDLAAKHRTLVDMTKGATPTVTRTQHGASVTTPLATPARFPIFLDAYQARLLDEMIVDTGFYDENDLAQVDAFDAIYEQVLDVRESHDQLMDVEFVSERSEPVMAWTLQYRECAMMPNDASRNVQAGLAHSKVKALWTDRGVVDGGVTFSYFIENAGKPKETDVALVACILQSKDWAIYGPDEVLTSERV